MAIDLYLAVATLGLFVGKYLHSFHKAMPENHHILRKVIISHLVVLGLIFLMISIK